MTTALRATLGLACAAALALVAFRRWVVAIPRVRAVPLEIPPTTSARTRWSDSALAESAATLVDNDPFRLANEPSSVRFDARSEGTSGSEGSQPFSPPPVRPTFALRAIVGGPPWQAIVDGFPGQAASMIVRKGSVVDRISVTNVTRDSVLLRGPDTAWVLTFRRSP